MIGPFLTRGLVMVLGYAYPAYECYKTVEMNKPEIDQLRFWCQYWILVAVLTVCERIGDAFVSWVPMYSEAKLAFFLYLWYPKTKGTTFVYDSFFKPYVSKHESEIDRNLLEIRTRAGDIALLYWQRAASYGQTRIYDILQYVAEQSTPRPLSTRTHQRGAKGHQTSAASNRQTTTTITERDTEEPPSPTSSTSSTQIQKDAAEEAAPTQAPKSDATTVAGSSTSKEAAASEKTSQLPPTEVAPMQSEQVPPSADENENSTPKETVMEGVIRSQRGRLRKTRSAGNH